MNLREAGGAALVYCQFRFRLPHAEACTPRNVAALLGIALAQTSLRKPSRTLQGTRKTIWPPTASRRVRQSVTACLNRSCMFILERTPVTRKSETGGPQRGFVLERTVNHLFDFVSPLPQRFTQ